jgi:predicted nuclease of restriction endonuclease-like (RecB) superfamily
MVKKKSQSAVIRSGFTALLTEVKNRIQSAQTRAVLAVNAELVRLYWDIGRIIDRRQQNEGWGTGVIPRLAKELKNEIPDLKGFSERNIGRMISFYREYPDPSEISPPKAKFPHVTPILPHAAAKMTLPAKMPQPAAKFEHATFWLIPWFHHVMLIEKVKDLPARRWYMEKTLANGWSRNVLAIQIAAQAHRRQGKAVSNFAAALPSPQSDLARQTLKDPYIFGRIQFRWHRQAHRHLHLRTHTRLAARIAFRLAHG